MDLITLDQVVIEPVQKIEAKSKVNTRKRLIRSSSPSKATALLPVFGLEIKSFWIFLFYVSQKKAMFNASE